MGGFSSAFENELDKLGFALPAYMKDPRYIFGSVLAGLVIGDMLKREALPVGVTREMILGRGKGRVEAKKWVAGLLKKEPTDKPVEVVTNRKEVAEMLRDPKFGLLARVLIGAQATSIVEEGGNAAALQGTKKDYIIVPPQLNPRVTEHELGHIRDIAAGHDRPGVLKSLIGMFWKPTYEKEVMGRERRAWEYAKPTPLAEKAVKTYERGFHTRRAKTLAPLALNLILGGLKRASSGIR